ncbi:MAG: SPOR domain-containing protein [Chitinophagales bacterium]
MKQIFVVLLAATCMCLQFSCKGTKKVQTPILIGGYEKKDVHFKVQIGAFSEEKTEASDFFTNIAGEEVRMDIGPNGLFRYSVGYFKNYEEADNYEEDLKGRGYSEAFVVAYGDDDKRIEMPMGKILDLYNKGS